MGFVYRKVKVRNFTRFNNEDTPSLNLLFTGYGRIEVQGRAWDVGRGTSNAMTTKADIRREARLVRSQLSDAVRISANERITDRLLKLVEEIAPRTVHVYWPIEKNREVDTRSFIRQLLDRGVVVALPVLSTIEDGVMEQRQLISELDFELSRFGTQEPASGPTIDPVDTDLVVAPALAADRRGYRVGYGGGYYDRFLLRTRCPRAVAVYSPCLLDQISEDVHDIQMDYVITELQTILTAGLAT